MKVVTADYEVPVSSKRQNPSEKGGMNVQRTVRGSKRDDDWPRCFLGADE